MPKRKSAATAPLVPQAPASVIVSLRVHQHCIEQIDKLASRERRTRNNMINVLLERAIEGSSSK